MQPMTSMSLWLAGFLLLGVTTLLAMAGSVYVRRHVSLERLQDNNEIAGFKFATVGVLYAVLLAFVVVVVWEKFSRAEDVVAGEAGAAATLYRLADGLGEAEREPLRSAVTAYLTAATEYDWPAMATGGESRQAVVALDGLYAAWLAVGARDNREAMLLSAALDQLDALTEARRERIVLAPGAVPPVIWIVLVAGAVVTVCFTFFFGSRNFRAQVMMTGVLNLMIFAGLLVIVAIDRPFVGTVMVPPEPLVSVLRDFGSRRPT